MTLRPYTPADYYMTSKWREVHGQPAIPEAILPTCGMVAENGGVAVGAVWMFMANCKGVSVLCFWVSNPGSKARDVAAAMSALMEGMTAGAAALGYGVCLSLVPEQGGLAKLSRRNGFDALGDVPHLLLGKINPLPPK